MKVILFPSARVRRFTPPHVNKLLTTLICSMLYCLNSFAQSPNPYTNYYYPYSTFDFNNPESYVVQRYYKTSNNAFDGTIMIQRVDDGNDDAIQLTLVDEDGNFKQAFYVFYNITGNFTPTCAAYNATAQQYCIAGIHEGTGNSSATTQSWFLMLDRDLNFLEAKSIGATISGISPLSNLFVTDITSAEAGSSSTLGKFVYSGVAGNAVDPSPTYSTTYHKQMYMGYVSYDATIPGTVFGATRAFNYNGAYNDNQFFPSRIIEIPMSSPDGGFVIAGTGLGGGLFFTRTDYNFNDNGNTELYVPNSGITISAGDLYFDPAQNEVWFAGSYLEEYYNSIIYQKLINLTNAGITLYVGGVITTTDNFARNYLPDPIGFPKVAKIMPTTVSTEAVIAVNTYETTYINSSYYVTYPSLHRISYLDADMHDFYTGGQSPLQYMYPRTVTGNLGVTNYLSYLSYNRLNYPAHTAHYLPMNIFHEDYILGSSCFDVSHPNNPSYPERIVLNRTNNYYENLCNVISDYMTPDHFHTSHVSPQIYTSLTSSPLQAINLSYTNSISQIDYVACDSDPNSPYYFPFKSSNGNAFATSTQLNASIVNSTLTIKSIVRKGVYRMYNAMGEIILNGTLSSGYAMKDISNLSDGIYLIELLDNENRKVGIQKIIK